MEAMKAEKYQCSFKGISTLDQQAENDVEFTLFEADKNQLRMQINYKGRNDFYYEISIIKQ